MVDGIHEKSDCSFVRKAVVALTHATTPPTPARPALGSRAELCRVNLGA